MSRNETRRAAGAIRRAAVALSAAICVTATLLAAPISAEALPGRAPATATAGALDPSQFHGVNWADPRDNFADDQVVPSGLLVTDDAATVAAKTRGIIAGFRANLGANTVRLPVNPYSVGTPWWTSYRAAIDTATAMGFNVVLSYWEGTGTRADGRIDDVATWNSMWNTLTTTYADNAHVYFEPMNEPHGYSPTDWKNIVATWLSDHSSIPRDRVFVSGSGYNDHVDDLCTDPRFHGTYLSLHHYGFWGTHSYAGWVKDMTDRLGSCANRTIEDEFGSPMTTGLNYADPAATDNFIAYLQADTNVARQLGMGSVYWPGLRTGDSYSMESLTGSGTDLSLTTNSASGAALLAWSWTGGAFAVTPRAAGTAVPRASAVPLAGTGLPVFDSVTVSYLDSIGSRHDATIGTPTRDATGAFTVTADLPKLSPEQSHVDVTLTVVNTASGVIDPAVKPVTATLDVLLPPALQRIPVPAAPAIHDHCGRTHDTVDLPANTTRVHWRYLIPGGDHANRRNTVAVRATVTPGYVFADGTTTQSWTLRFTNRPCPIPEPPASAPEWLRAGWLVLFWVFGW